MVLVADAVQLGAPPPDGDHELSALGAGDRPGRAHGHAVEPAGPTSDTSFWPSPARAARSAWRGRSRTRIERRVRPMVTSSMAPKDRDGDLTATHPAVARVRQAIARSLRRHDSEEDR